MNQRIKELRAYLGLSQSEFAQKIGKSSGFISLIETGQVNPSPRTLHAICDSFHVNELWLTEGKGLMFSSPTQIAPVNREGAGERLRELRKKLGLTQQVFAEKLGYSKVQITSVCSA